MPTVMERQPFDTAMAREFMPRAKAAAAQLGIQWPESFERATLEYLRRMFGHEFDVSW